MMILILKILMIQLIMMLTMMSMVMLINAEQWLLTTGVTWDVTIITHQGHIKHVSKLSMIKIC